MKLLVLLTALLLAGCSVEVAHETENRVQTESISTFDKSKTAVAVDILNEPESSPEIKPDAPAVQRSTTILKVVMPKSSPEVVTPPPPVIRCPEPTIRVAGSDNTVIFGDVHVHHHKHFHFHKTPKPTPVRIDVRVEMDDRIGERERRRRMVEKRIAKFFPHYRD